MRSTMPTYKMVSSDYPSNTFTKLTCYDKGGTNAKFELHLPLPNQITYQTSFDWSAEEVPLVAQTAIDSYFKESAVGLNADQAQNGFVETMKTMGKQTGAALGKMFVMGASRMFTGGEGAGKYFFQTGFGIAYNPNKHLFFNGIDHRPLTVSFDIIPQNASQAAQCAQGIKQMRVAASPSYSETQAFFTYPLYFSLDAVVNGSVVLQYNKFAITSINTNLSPNGMMSWHADGKPVAYTLEISGLEAEISTSTVEGKRKFMGA